MIFSFTGALSICTAALLLAQASPDPTAAYRHVGATPPPHGYPVIKSMSLSTTNVQAGRAVNGTIETSANVSYVEARISYRNVALHEEGPGKFTLTYTVPWWLPLWLRHDYTLEIVARTIDGVEAWRGIPIHVH